jgi:predicted transcriptional regulator
MPNQPKTPHRSIRIDDETWAHLAKVADQHKISLSEVVRLALADFLRRSSN